MQLYGVKSGSSIYNESIGWGEDCAELFIENVKLRSSSVRGSGIGPAGPAIGGPMF